MKENSGQWICDACGKVNNKGTFCAQCGKARSVDTWACSKCGKQDNHGKFCAQCGQAKSANSWTCMHCGKTDNHGKFCKQCGVEKNGSQAMDSQGTVDAKSTTQAQGQVIYTMQQDSNQTATVSKGKPMSKTTKGVIVVALLLVVAYFGYGMVIEKLYFSKCENFIALSADTSKAIADIADLNGDSGAEETKQIVSQFDATAEKLGEIHDSLAGMKAPDTMKNQHEKLLTVIERDKDVLTKAGAILKYEDRVISPAEQKKYAEAYDAYGKAMQELRASMNDVTIKGREVKQILGYDKFEANMRKYVNKKLTNDRQYVTNMMNEYQNKRRAVNDEAKKKNEVVFLPENVRKEGNNLVVQGRFYNGTADFVSGLKEMLVDVTLYNYDKEVMRIKDVAYNDMHLVNLAISSKGSSWPVTLKLEGKAPDERFNNFEVNVHKIHWVVRRTTGR